MHPTDKTQDRTTRAAYPALLAALTILANGCGAVTVRHVPQPGAISSSKLSDLHGSQPIEIKAGECSATETNIGTVGMGKVVGKMSEWTDATVNAIRTNLVARGATVSAGAPKALTVTMTKAEVKAIPFVGGAKSKVALAASTPDGLNTTFEGSGGSLAPLGAVDGAVKDAIQKLLTDSAVEAYLRK